MPYGVSRFPDRIVDSDDIERQSESFLKMCRSLFELLCRTFQTCFEPFENFFEPVER